MVKILLELALNCAHVRSQLPFKLMHMMEIDAALLHVQIPLMLTIY